MDMKKSKRFLLGLAAIYWALVLMIYAVAHEQFHYTAVTSDALSPIASIGELVDGMEVRQRMTVPADRMDSLDIMAGTYGRANTGVLRMVLTDEAGAVVGQGTAELGMFLEGKYTTVPLEQPVEDRRGEKLTLTLTTEGCASGNALTLYFGNTITAGRFDIAQTVPQDELYTVNGETGTGKLCIKMNGIQVLSFYRWYWPIMCVLFAMACAYVLSCLKQAQQGKNNPIVLLCTTYSRYGFLIRQLVSRDFKAKYKRSALGMAWSFLNPLLTMAVQYIVFSTLFKSDTPNYPVYLLSGIVFFSFFSEAVSMGMTSVTGNASLIKKVYMPKYIYPVSRILSSLVNFGLAIIPLFLVMLVTGTAFTPALLLLIFDVLCLLGFVTGMVLLLSTAMTFFQDTQFLWGVVSMMWMYLTPLFYTENIIPQKLLVFYHMNPMYQYITFARVCIISGASPAPTAYLWCVVSSVAVLLLGILTFKHHQDKFALYL
ncbi:MAG: ABC transporter permease [Clostridia bacterium]|nr:ABC transporter permease [Clostridia bacterium]